MSVYIPTKNILNQEAIRNFAQYRNNVLQQLKGVILPQYEDQAYVDRTHLVAVRRILIENGVIDEVRFDSILEKVSVTHCN